MCEYQEEVLTCLWTSSSMLALITACKSVSASRLQTTSAHTITFKKQYHLSMEGLEHILQFQNSLIVQECSILHLTVHLKANIKVWRFYLHRLLTHILKDKIQITIILCLQYVQQSASSLSWKCFTHQVANIKWDTTSIYKRSFIR